MRIILIGLTVFACALTWGGVNKCTDAKGRVTYSQTPCSPNTNAAQIRTVDNAIMDGAVYQRYQAQREAQERAEAAAEAEDQRQRQISAMNDTRNDACYRAYRSAGIYEGEGEKRARAAAVKVCQAMSNNPPVAPANVAPAKIIPMPNKSPTLITNCNSSGCFDNHGQFYPKGAGNTYIAPNGMACHSSGGWFSCP